MTDARHILSEDLQEKVATFPESSMGAHRVTVVLRDGTRVHEVYIGGNGRVVKVGSSFDIPFDVRDVIDVLNETIA